MELQEINNLAVFAFMLAMVLCGVSSFGSLVAIQIYSPKTALWFMRITGGLGILLFIISFLIA